MRVSIVLQAGCFLALAGLAACGDQPATEPSAADAAGLREEVVRRRGDPRRPPHADPDQRPAGGQALERSGSRRPRSGTRPKWYDAQSATVIIANNRTHLIGSQWVPGDPRRDGRIGVTYAVDPQLQTFLTGLGFPVPVIENGAGFRLSSQAELDGLIEQTMQAWRDRKCADAPIERVAVRGRHRPRPARRSSSSDARAPSATYAQPADIVQAGWQPAEFFDAITPGGSDAILGITFTFSFVDDQGTADEADDVPTDINGDGKNDTGLAEIYYNPTFIWTTRGAPQHDRLLLGPDPRDRPLAGSRALRQGVHHQEGCGRRPARSPTSSTRRRP